MGNERIITQGYIVQWLSLKWSHVLEGLTLEELSKTSSSRIQGSVVVVFFS